MRYTFTGKNINVAENTKERVIKKLDKLDKYIPENTEAHISFSAIKQDHTVEVTIPLHKRTLRAEVTLEDMYSAIDEVVDKLEKQMVKYKDRLRDKSKKDQNYKNELEASFPQHEDNDESDIKIDKVKRFALKPMDAEEAVMEMELLGHGFYMFRNGSTDEVNLVYKRKDGSYGLIEPEF